MKLIKNWNITISILIVIFFCVGVYYITNTTDIEEEITISDCLELTEKLMPSNIKLTEWDAAEIDKVNEIPVSINNQYAKALQESTKEVGGYITNYGPFIMEKTLEKGRKPVPETNPELIKCYKDKIQIGMWR